MSKIDKYDVSLTNFDIVDISKELDVWKQHRYCFNPLTQIPNYNRDTDYDIILMDRDLSFKRSFDDYLLGDGILIGNKEHYVETANPLWGERYAFKQSGLETEFWVYNKSI